MIAVIRDHIIPAAYAVLPPAMKSVEATAMLLAIGQQESRWEHRAQIGGPAKSFLQFEQGGGVKGVLSHAATAVIARDAFKALRYPRDMTVPDAFNAMQHNDVLALVFGRLLLWTMPQPMPRRDQQAAGWLIYLGAWRPGKAHPQSWGEAWRIGWGE